MALLRSTLVLFVGTVSVIVADKPVQAADYQKYVYSGCGLEAPCLIDFPNVPAGKVLTLSNLSCYLRFYEGYSLFATQLWVVNNNTGDIVMAVTPSLQYQTTTYNSEGVRHKVYVSNDTIHVFAKPGQHFRAYAEIRDVGGANSPELFACGISGKITP